MKEYNIDIVHTHRYVMQYAIPAAIMAGVKVRIHTVHNIATKEVDGYRRILAHFFFKHCSVIPVSISPLIQKSVMKEYHITNEQTPVIYNGSDLNKCLIKTDYRASNFWMLGCTTPNLSIRVRTTLKELSIASCTELRIAFSTSASLL